MKADRLRIESLARKKAAYVQQKKAVQQSLSNINTCNKRIVFDSPNIVESEKPKHKPSKLLFEDEDIDCDDFSNNFDIKKQFEGEEGAKLQKLESRFQGDQRFKIDERFMDDRFAGNEKEVFNNEVSDERRWQYDVLERVIGKKLQPDNKKTSINPMLRYDPTRNEHRKYEKSKDRKSTGIGSDTYLSEDTKSQQQNDFQVSKDQFYKVTQHLTSSLQPSLENFSLLSMFGRDTKPAENAALNPYNEILLSRNHVAPYSAMSQYNQDSSDEDVTQQEISVRRIDSSTTSNEPKAMKNAEMWHEPFFIFGNDQRFNDGLMFFLPDPVNTNSYVEFEDKQKDMRDIIKKKIKKSIKNVLPRGAKPNKRFGRLIRNV